MRIRRATIEDADELARLRWDFRSEAGTPVTTTFDAFVAAFRSFVHDVLDRDTWWAWLAEDDDARTIGCVWIQLVEKVPHPSRERWERPFAYLTNMYVEEAHRGTGAGRALLDAAVDAATERGVDGVLLWPSETSVGFYRAAGFDPTPWLWRHVAGD